MVRSILISVNIEMLSPRICTRVWVRCLAFTHCMTIFKEGSR